MTEKWKYALGRSQNVESWRDSDKAFYTPICSLYEPIWALDWRVKEFSHLDLFFVVKILLLGKVMLR